MKIAFKNGDMKIILDYQELVYMKGNQAQVEKFNKDGRLPSNQLNSILKRCEEEYEHVEFEGRGKDTVFALINKRSTPLALDKRKNNKATGKKTKFANQLELLIVKALRDEDSKSIEGSIGTVMFQMKMANGKLCYYRQPNRVDNYVSTFQKNEIAISKEFLIHVLDKEHNVLSGALLTALESLRKKKLLKWSKYPVGVSEEFHPEYGEMTGKPIVDDEGNAIGHAEYHYIILTHDEVTQLAEIERTLRSKHNVSSFQITHYPYSANVQAYTNELKRKFRRLGIKYYFDCFSICLIAPEEEVDQLIEDNGWMIEEDYMTKYINYTIGKANKRQEKYLQEQQFFGERIALPPVEKALDDNIYVEQYKTTMKHTVVPSEYQELLD